MCQTLADPALEPETTHTTDLTIAELTKLAIPFNRVALAALMCKELAAARMRGEDLIVSYVPVNRKSALSFYRLETPTDANRPASIDDHKALAQLPKSLAFRATAADKRKLPILVLALPGAGLPISYKAPAVVISEAASRRADDERKALAKPLAVFVPLIPKI